MLTSFAVLLAAVQATPSPAAVPSAPLTAPGRSLRDLPGIKITYHDISEKDLKDITKALAKKKPLTPAQQALLGATTDWKTNPRMTQLKKGTECTATSAAINFSASADLPRFNPASLKPADAAEWTKYLALTEAQAAEKLWFAYDRRTAFEQAVVGKPCDVASRDGNAALDKMKADAAAFQPTVR
ncbi:DUF922 domain-containing Zn-dependent protease [Sphingomonas piscis]|uniref:DUF922 domain-containing Zn-dependent protease n=1 Tax=Sphingomonas piscis TaxID=2714943 RepID=A0A6G7YR77_9SPHN|nr:DUF922 domain-containing protein [Sphingomonas piscis]QIK79234.1 DUF922 domain-containing Zn-dependent protease [Sphingomonas piscis]